MKGKISFLLFFAIILAALLASYLSSPKVSNEILNNHNKQPYEKLIYKPSSVLYKSYNSSERKWVFILRTKDSLNEVKAYYVILASQEGWETLSEIPIHMGISLTFKAGEKEIEISIAEKSGGSQITINFYES